MLFKILMKFWRNSDFRIFNEFCDYFWSFFLLTKFFKNFKNSMKFELNSWRILAHNFWQISSLFKVQEFFQNSWKTFYEFSVFSEFWHNYSRIRDEFLTNFQKTNLRSLEICVALDTPQTSVGYVLIHASVNEWISWCAWMLTTKSHKSSDLPHLGRKRHCLASETLKCL